jgi:hypothetical protein
MGVRFLAISGEDRKVIAKAVMDRKVIAKAVMEHLESSKEDIDPKHLQTLQTLIIEPEQVEALTK